MLNESLSRTLIKYCQLVEIVSVMVSTRSLFETDDKAYLSAKALKAQQGNNFLHVAQR